MNRSIAKILCSSHNISINTPSMQVNVLFSIISMRYQFSFLRPFCRRQHITSSVFQKSLFLIPFYKSLYRQVKRHVLSSLDLSGRLAIGGDNASKNRKKNSQFNCLHALVYRLRFIEFYVHVEPFGMLVVDGFYPKWSLRIFF